MVYKKVIKEILSSTDEVDVQELCSRVIEIAVATNELQILAAEALPEYLRSIIVTSRSTSSSVDFQAPTKEELDNSGKKKNKFYANIGGFQSQQRQLYSIMDILPSSLLESHYMGANGKQKKYKNFTCADLQAQIDINKKIIESATSAKSRHSKLLDMMKTQGVKSLGELQVIQEVKESLVV